MGKTLHSRSFFVRYGLGREDLMTDGMRPKEGYSKISSGVKGDAVHPCLIYAFIPESSIAHYCMCSTVHQCTYRTMLRCHFATFPLHGDVGESGGESKIARHLIAVSVSVSVSPQHLSPTYHLVCYTTKIIMHGHSSSVLHAKNVAVITGGA